jgi:hypothetical protein
MSQHSHIKSPPLCKLSRVLHLFSLRQCNSCALLMIGASVTSAFSVVYCYCERTVVKLSLG